MGAFSFYIEDYERSIPPSQQLITNRAFLYGEGATTCSLLRRGKILFWPDHLDRLEQSWLSFYPQCPPSLLRGKIAKNIGRIPHFQRDHYVKICLFANDLGREIDRKAWDRMPNMAIYGGEYSPKDVPVCLKTVTRRNAWYRDFQKVPYYLDELRDRAMAHALAYSDVLYTTAAGYVLGGSLSNVFLIRGDRVFTPSPSLPILHGVARKNMIRLLGRFGISIEQRMIHRGELATMDGLLLSNSLNQMLIVQQLDGRKLHCPFALELQWLYRRGREEYFNGDEQSGSVPPVWKRI